MTVRACLVLGLVGVALASAMPAPAHAARAVVVKTQDIGPYNLAVEGFRRAFPGEVTVIDLGEDEDVSAAMARQIRSHQPDAIIAIGSRAATSLKERIDDIPIVFCMVLNPGERGLSGPNITGIALEIPASEQLAQFRRVVPELRRVGIVYNPARSGPAVDAAKAAARAAGVQIVERQVSRPGEVPDAIDALVDSAEGLWLLPDASVVTNETFRHILLTSLERRVPLLVFSAPFVRAGALVGVAPNYTRIGEEAAGIVAEVMRGRAAGSIPLRDPPAAVVINAATAARIGIEISADLRATATIIQ
jgi:putative tryptophan/tyrosine transport system substrate-binding protein